MQDPSLSHATQKPIHNLLGFPGAIFSDLAMQLLGLASVLLLLPEALLGWRLLSHRPLGEKWRGLIWILATFLAAAFVSTLPRSHAWPLPTGLGGVFGDALLRAPALDHGRAAGGVHAACGVGAARPRHAAHACDRHRPALAARRAEKPARHDIDDDEMADAEDEDAEDDHASAWLGLIAHALLSSRRASSGCSGARRARRCPRRDRPAHAWSRASTVSAA